MGAGKRSMRAEAGAIAVSPSDITAFLACEHLIQLEVAAVRGELPRPLRDDPQGDLVKRLGTEHEIRYLERLRREGRGVIEIPLAEVDWDWERAARETEEALRSRADVV